MIANKKARDPSAKSGSPYFSRAVGKALNALEILRRSPQPLALAEMAGRLKLAKSSALRLLRTLESAGYIARDTAKLYFISSEARTLVPVRFLGRLVGAATPHLKELNRVFRETVSLAALFDNHIEVVAVEESPNIIRMANIVGRILQPNASSLGKVIVAFQAEQRRERLLRTYGIYPFTPNTITDEMELKREFDRVRAAGYAEDRAESVPGGHCFAVPIFAEGKQALAAMSISLPESRFAEGDRERIVPALRKAAAAISAELG